MIAYIFGLKLNSPDTNTVSNSRVEPASVQQSCNSFLANVCVLLLLLCLKALNIQLGPKYITDSVIGGRDSKLYA